MKIEVKDCRTCPFRQEDANYSTSDYTWFCNQQKGVMLQLTPQEAGSENSFLPEKCPLKTQSFEVMLEGSETEVAEKKKIQRKPRKKKEDGTTQSGISQTDTTKV